MKVLVVKLSSLGDVIHTLPALTDAGRHISGIEFDWVVEEGFSEIPGWHDCVGAVIELAFRRWRRSVGLGIFSGEFGRFVSRLRREKYDKILDVQGLSKSAWVSLMARGTRYGFDARSVREPGFTWTYHRRLSIPKGLHAVERIRRFFAEALGYAMPPTEPDFGLSLTGEGEEGRVPFVVMLPGATWPNKRWGTASWVELANRANQAGLEVRVTAGTDREYREWQERLSHLPMSRPVTRCGLTGLASKLAQARGFVGVDTGLSHLCGALKVPGITLYGPTAPELTAPVGRESRQLKGTAPCVPCKRRRCTHPEWREDHAPPCLFALSPEEVWGTLEETMRSP